MYATMMEISWPSTSTNPDEPTIVAQFVKTDQWEPDPELEEENESNLESYYEGKTSSKDEIYILWEHLVFNKDLCIKISPDIINKLKHAYHITGQDYTLQRELKKSAEMIVVKKCHCWRSDSTL